MLGPVVLVVVVLGGSIPPVFLHEFDNEQRMYRPRVRKPLRAEAQYWQLVLLSGDFERHQ
jgi:hypothetical protein